MSKRLRIKAPAEPAMSVARRAIKHKELVYVICAPKSQKYGTKRSRIIYIGMTSKGVQRVASSIAYKAIDFLEEWGVKRLDVYLATCVGSAADKSWQDLERDLLIAFKLEYGRVPLANKSGQNYSPDRLSGRFNYKRLVKVLDCYSREAARPRVRRVKPVK